MDNHTGRTYFDGPPGDHYLILRSTKAPLSWETFSLDEAGGNAHVGIKLSEPWLVVDVDNEDEGERLLRLVQEECIKTRVMKTTKGYHFWFVAREPMKNNTRTMTAIGLTADYRSWGKNAQVCVKLNGTWREWLTETPWDEVEEIPRWLRPLRQDKYRFVGLKDGDGRNSALYEYQMVLAKHAFSPEQGREVIRLINQYIVDEPLPMDEIQTVAREEAYPKPAEETADGSTFDPETPWLLVNKNGSVAFLHQKMAERIATDLNPISWQGRIYIYKDGYYQQTETEVLREMIRLWPGIKISHRREVLEYLRILTEVERPEGEDCTVNVLNGRLNLLTGALTEHTPEKIDFQRINATYCKSTFCEPLDRMLWKVFCDDPQLMRLFEEIVGYCLVKNSDFHKMFIFTGDGSNGKSTVIKIIKTFLGHDNVSTVSLQGFEDKFKVAELQDKLANLGDDIPFLQIKDASIMKVLTSGDPITVERKNERPFTLKNYAKLIFSTNKMPAINDHTDGLGRRMCIIPFDAKFSEHDADYDPKIGQKVTTPEAMSYMLNLAVRGLRRLVARGRFTESEKVRAALLKFQRDNDSVLAWMDDEEVAEEDVVEKPVAEVYQAYVLYCQANGNQPKKQTSVTQTLNKKYGLLQAVAKRGSKSTRIFRRVS